jgi:hypothetical protein
MSNLTTIQLAFFYTMIAIMAIQVILAVLFFKSSVRYYIMISRKIIFRNIEFIDGEIVLIGKQNDEEGVEKLISQGHQKIKSDLTSNVSNSKIEDYERDHHSINMESQQEDLDLMNFENYTSDPGEFDSEHHVIFEDLDLEHEIEAGLQDEHFSGAILNQKNSLIEIPEDQRLQALDVLHKISTEIANSFLPQSNLNDITNEFDIEVCHELERLSFSESSILFYRQIGNKIISSRFEEFLNGVNKLKIELSEQEKKKPKPNSDNETIVNDETEDFFLDRIAGLRQKTSRALLKTSKNLSFQIDFAVSA